MRLTPTDARIFCKTYTWLSGAVLNTSPNAVSLRTWVYRVAHNVATSHVIRQQRTYAALLSLEEVETIAVRQEDEFGLDRRMIREHLLLLIQRLKPIDRQVILSYLEGMDAASIGEITGMSPANVAMKIHRVKSILTRRLQKGGQHAR